MAEKAPRPSRPRQADRLQHELLVAYRTVDGFITDWAVNISRGGIFINTRNPLAVGTVGRLIISLPDAASPYATTGTAASGSEMISRTTVPTASGLRVLMKM